MAIITPSLCIAILAAIAMSPVYAAPTGADLLAACTQAEATSYQSLEGQMCSWYVMPCDCDNNPALTPVCAPDSVQTHTLAAMIISALAADPGLHELDAAIAANRVLAQEYPCN